MKVTEVRESHNGVIVSFDDGHSAMFEPYTHGFGYQVEGLRHFFLYNDEQLVCQYDSRLCCCGPQEHEHQVVIITDGYTPQRVAEYWRTASKHVNEEYFEKPYREGREGPKEFWYPWIVIKEGRQDLSMLEEGRTSLRG